MQAAETPLRPLSAHRLRFKSAFLAFTLAALSAHAAAPKPPEAGKETKAPQFPSAQLPGNVDKAKLDAALKAFDAPQPELGVTQTLMILHNGAAVLERYAPTYGHDVRVNSWNLGAAITGVLAGRALKTGALKSLDEPSGLSEWTIAADDRQKITIRNLLYMNSGLAWRERGADAETASDGDKMLFGDGQMNVARYATSAKAKNKPGETFVYSTGSSVLAAAALQRRLPPVNLSDGLRTFALRKFMNEELFAKLGMTSASPQFDKSGNFLSSLIWMSPHDMAAFGEFCLRDGVWNKERLLPEGWIQTLRTPSSAADGQSYGGGFWIKAKGKPDTLIASLPDDAYAAGGDRGAVIVMIPSKDLVIVRTGITPFGEKSRAALGRWLGEVAAAFPDGEP